MGAVGSSRGTFARAIERRNVMVAEATARELTADWADSKTRTAALAVWERAWERVIPFLAFPEEIRRIVYTTDEIVNRESPVVVVTSSDQHFVGAFGVLGDRSFLVA